MGKDLEPIREIAKTQFKDIRGGEIADVIYREFGFSPRERFRGGFVIKAGFNQESGLIIRAYGDQHYRELTADCKGRLSFKHTSINNEWSRTSVSETGVVSVTSLVYVDMPQGRTSLELAIPIPESQAEDARKTIRSIGRKVIPLVRAEFDPLKHNERPPSRSQ